MEKIKKTPSWLKRGTLSSILIALLIFIGESIFQLKIQNTYQNTVEPYLLASLQISITTNRLQIAAFILLVFILVFSVFLVFEKRIRAYYNRKWLVITEPEFQSYTGPVGLNPTEVITEIVKLRKGDSSVDKVIPIILHAANSKVITPQAAAESLEEFHYILIMLSDGRYTAGKE